MDYLDYNFDKFASEIHQNAKDKGFWDGIRNEGELFMLMISELGEALEAHRKGKRANTSMFLHWAETDVAKNPAFFKHLFEANVKDTFEDEIADTVIRILDYAAFEKIEIDLFKWEQLGDFTAYENVGQSLMGVVSTLHYAYEVEKEKAESQINAALLRLFHISGQNNFDLIYHMKLKHLYNQQRQRLHGKVY